VSQFTLLAQFKGTKPDFHESMSTIPGKAFYTDFLGEIKAAYRADRIQDALPHPEDARLLGRLAWGMAELARHQTSGQMLGGSLRSIQYGSGRWLME
jgi:hypothetical protein